jgi:hypothetical protein
MSSNDKRRHMTKGQQAMIAAEVRSLNEQSARNAAKSVGVATGYVAQASIVLQHAPDLVDAVMEGAPLNAAYAIAQKRKADAESEESKLKRLRAESPDLADQVAEEKLTLAECLGALEARNQKKRQEEEEHQRALREGASILGQIILQCEPYARGNGRAISR